MADKTNIETPAEENSANTDSTHGCKVFVYGTLKKGHGNHRLLRQSRYLGRCYVEGKWGMVNLGAFPAVVEAETPTKIFGEVYLIDTKTLMSLDILEGYPTFYTRTKVDTPWKKAWMYHLNTQHRDMQQYDLMNFACWSPSTDEREWAQGLANTG